MFHLASEKSMIQNFILAVVLLLVVACGSSYSLFQPTEREAAKMSTNGTKLTIEELQNGYKLYVSNCGGCHSLHIPSSKNKMVWEKVLPVMFSKAKLNETQQALIRQYIYSKL